ncbi:hypothetical protein SteCoe_32067 [Stentor coeruleus]|uniref:Rab-GAP TBC domain-containing protein n=1 Tax=Stentor coeruleus TaxID=5963 RepID=A0A1R2AZW2_9CILI|nr:hypothetical protein SteCoe_32067 [Stentor coeruleus]
MGDGQVDKYGFVVPRGNRTFKEIPPLKYMARMEKWENMLSNWENFKSNKLNLLKNRVRKGIPDPLRSRVWLLIADGLTIRSSYPKHLYFRLTNTEEEPPCINVINRDLDRTFPGHELYRTIEGQQSLRNILRAYAFFDTEIGYCQGMGYIAGIARMYMDEENTFWILVALMNNYDMRGMFKRGMQHVYKSFYKASSLLRQYESGIWRKLNDNDMNPQVYATQWFMTIYSSFPIETVLRIWDCFLLEGPKILYRVYIGFFKMNKNEFKEATFEGLLKKIRELESNCDCDLLIKAAFGLSLSHKRIAELDREYTVSPNMDIVKWSLN